MLYSTNFVHLIHNYYILQGKLGHMSLWLCWEQNHLRNEHIKDIHSHKYILYSNQFYISRLLHISHLLKRTLLHSLYKCYLR